MEKTEASIEIENILNDPAFQKKLARLSVQTGATHLLLKTEAEIYLNELYSEHQPTTNMLFLETFQYMLNQGYDKNIDINPAEIKALVKLIRKHPVAFVLR